MREEKGVDRLTIEKYLQSFVDNPGYLQKSGWLRSMQVKETVAADGSPIPWITYPAIDFLADRITTEMKVFEYGSGNSTFWWSSRVNEVVSCEHDKEWYAYFQGRMPTNVSYLLRRAKGGSTAYVDEITKYNDMFDILVIDGRQRVQCAYNGFAALRDEGVVVWDNSDRKEYQPGFDYLCAKGCKRVDFWGMGALATRRWCTSIFYRHNNCLDI